MTYDRFGASMRSAKALAGNILAKPGEQMAEEPLSGPEIKKIISKSRKKPVGFAFNPGKDDADGYLLLHLKKPPKALGKQAKSEGEGGKAAFGTFETEGKVMKLDCELSIPALSKKLMKYLKSQKISLQPVVLGEEDLDAALAEFNQAEDAFNDEFDDDSDDEDAPVSGGADATEVEARVKAMAAAFKTLPDPAKAKLAKPVQAIVAAFKAGKLEQTAAALDKVMPAIETVQAKGKTPDTPDGQVDRGQLETQLKDLASRVKQLEDPQRSKLAKAVQTLVGTLKAGDLAKTSAGLAKLAQALDSLAPQTAPETSEDNKLDPNQAKYTQLFTAMEPLVQTALRDNRFADEKSRGDFKKLWEWANNNAADGIYDKAVAALTRAKPLLEAARASDGSDYAADVPDDVKPFAISRLKWKSTLSTIRSELKKLQASIKSVCGSDPELKPVADGVGELDEYLNRLDERLADKLDEVVNASPGDTRDALKAQARGILKEYQSELNSDFFKAVDAQNGFTNVAIASTANSALSKIESTLK